MDLAAGGVVVACWGVNPLLKKHMGAKLSSHESAALNHAAVTVAMLCLIAYAWFSGSFDPQNYKQLGRKEWVSTTLGAVTTVAAAICLFSLLKRRDASLVTPIVQPLALVCTLLVGVALFSEAWDRTKIAGIFLVCAGVVCLSLGKK